MDIHKVALLLKYILTAAGKEDFGNREVGPIDLVNYVYWSDLPQQDDCGARGKLLRSK